MQQIGPRLDPAPSRWSYRMQRLMLTPLYRNLLRVGLPFVIAFGSVTIYMSDDMRREAVVTGITDLRDQFQSRPEFMVSLMAIDGASTSVAEDIREILQLDFPVSSFDLDLEAILTAIRELPAVADARVRVRSGGILQVDVTERVPAVLWRTAQGLEVLDADGMITGPATSREEYATLPLIAGEGADKHVTEALDLVRAAGPLGARMRGLVRMGERRWDVVLDRDQRILLPEDAPVQALERVIALGQVHEMLERDLAVVDMRLAARPTIRMNAAAVEQWHELQATNAGIAGR
ncbi:MAG: cell division protein FtsQ/DivIB [Paracoccaceae bacterium]|jgi:cell division protein FtsQ|uniref:cell division protein FtsQ/DivIB n=1 Tax=unclassified Seohaeicola TaxID=2641111 RepID=UPI00237BDBC2|nr:MULTISPECIES: cell division protein FtsQ/DivIB [unclassified Seohaeicola]MDD9707582.1 cell division protein FtsQ/DivIB [Seohaeicola sp. 4SK31]MDD9735823.1 cell division protein FtsQ/DivIB [Seohaeicola sp. SP36]MDF1709450.1 cell division protein FtsQ/DivIB [Paracoccaceae bacterium]MDM7970495.1 cell division protein FtsQ/DivIB [Paracoccaceae bacterium]